MTNMCYFSTAYLSYNLFLLSDQKMKAIRSIDTRQIIPPTVIRKILLSARRFVAGKFVSIEVVLAPATEPWS